MCNNKELCFHIDDLWDINKLFLNKTKNTQKKYKKSMVRTFWKYSKEGSNQPPCTDMMPMNPNNDQDGMITLSMQ